MDHIYHLDNGNKIILYSMEHNIYLHTIPLSAKSHPMLIDNNFLEMLFSCIFDNTIYYAYKNTSNNLVLGHLNTRQPQIILNDEALLFQPSITGLFPVNKEHLCLPVILKNPLNDTFTVEVFILRPQLKRFSLIENLSDIPHLHFLVLNEYLYCIMQNTTNEKNPCIFYTNMQGHITRIPTLPTPIPPCTHCKELEEKIATITLQYNELVHTTKKIQEEGRHWKNMYESNSY